MRLDPPVDPSVRPEDIRPTNPPTEVRIVPESLRDDPERKAVPQAPGTFTVFRNTPLASAPVVGGAALSGFIPIEPSAAANGRVVFYTTNSYAAVSGDGGQSFSYLNPFDNFPADGTNDPIDGGFGGDQYVYYERTRGLMLWLLQYRNNGTTNRQRLAVARSQADALNNNWFFYDFSPANFNYTDPPGGPTGIWLDFPDLAVSDDFLYLSSNVFTVAPQVSLGAVVWRMPLNQLAQAQNLGINFYNDANQTYRLAQGAETTMYWGSHNTTAQIRIYRWADNSGTIFSDNVNHAAFNTGTMRATDPNGADFAGFADSRILAAWVANDVIGFMWNAAQGGGFTFPHVQVRRFNEGNRSLLDQGQIFNNNHAFLYPSVQVNDRGHLGGTMAWGGGTFFPNALAWIADDFNNGAITPLENVTFAAGNAGPCDPAFDPNPGNMTLDCYNRWGDYFATRLHSPSGLTWIGTGFVLNGANGVTRDPRYVWFGRERDTPPATNVIVVSHANNTGYEDGTLFHPYNTVGEGNFAAMPGDVVLIVSGNYNERPLLNRPSRLQRLGATGTVTIGRP